MKDWSGLAVIVLALLIFASYMLSKDRDPRRMNPRLESDRGTNIWQEFQLRNSIALALSFIVSYLLVRIFEWIWL